MILPEYCTELQVAEYGGESFRVGDRINFGDTVYRMDETIHVRVTGVVVALYVERHPNVLRWRPDGFVFAETIIDGEEARCWFERDKPRHASDLDGALGNAPEGAMF